MRSDDLAPLLMPPPQPGLSFRQGTVVTFNQDTGANTISVGGATLTDVPMLNSGEAVALKAGHIVALLTWKSSWWILGRVTLPGSDQFASASVKFGQGSAFASGFSISTSEAPKASITVNAPVWADEAIVTAIATGGGLNNSGANSQIILWTVIDGVAGPNHGSQGVPPGTAVLNVGATAAHQQRLFNPGTSFDVDVILRSSSSTWPASGLNFVSCSVSAIFRSTS